MTALKKDEFYPSPLKEIKDHLTKNAPTIFEQALRNKSISTNQITELIAPKYRSGKKFEEAMNLLTEVFINQGIFVTYQPFNRGTAIAKETPNPKDGTVSVDLTYQDHYGDKSKVLPIKRSKPVEEPTEEDSTVIEDEIHLQWIKEQMNHKVLTKETVYELIELAQNGSINARNVIIIHNQRLIRMIANKFYQCKILELGDLIQEGNFGLIRAIKKFDISLNMSFSTYAFRWINQFIYRAIMDLDDVIRVPVHMQELMRKSRKAIERAMQDQDFTPQVEHNLAWLGISPVALDKESAFNDESSLSLHDVLPDTRNIVGDIRMEAAEELRKRIKNVEKLVVSVTMLSLSDRHKRMFFMRYGINGEERHKTLQTIGDIFNVTRERIRQIVVKVWESLEPFKLIVTAETIEEELKVIFSLEKLTHRRVKI